MGTRDLEAAMLWRTGGRSSREARCASPSSSMLSHAGRGNSAEARKVRAKSCCQGEPKKSGKCRAAIQIGPSVSSVITTRTRTCLLTLHSASRRIRSFFTLAHSRRCLSPRAVGRVKMAPPLPPPVVVEHPPKYIHLPTPKSDYVSKGRASAQSSGSVSMVQKAQKVSPASVELIGKKKTATPATASTRTGGLKSDESTDTPDTHTYSNVQPIHKYENVKASWKPSIVFMPRKLGKSQPKPLWRAETSSPSKWKTPPPGEVKSVSVSGRSYTLQSTEPTTTNTNTNSKSNRIKSKSNRSTPRSRSRTNSTSSQYDTVGSRILNNSDRKRAKCRPWHCVVIGIVSIIILIVIICVSVLAGPSSTSGDKKSSTDDEAGRTNQSGRLFVEIGCGGGVTGDNNYDPCVIGTPPAKDTCTNGGRCARISYRARSSSDGMLTLENESRDFDNTASPATIAAESLNGAYCRDEQDRLGRCWNGQCRREVNVSMDDESWYVAEARWIDTCDDETAATCWTDGALVTNPNARETCRRRSIERCTPGVDALVWMQTLTCRGSRNRTARRICTGLPYKFWRCAKCPSSSPAMVISCFENGTIDRDEPCHVRCLDPHGVETGRIGLPNGAACTSTTSMENESYCFERKCYPVQAIRPDDPNDRSMIESVSECRKRFLKDSS